MNKIKIRDYQQNDAQHLAELYYNAIHNINKADYSNRQLNAWAPPSSKCADAWSKKWEKLIPVVALINDKVVGFTEFEDNGYIDCFFVHHEHQNQRIGSALMSAIEKSARVKGIDRIHANVSMTAQPFFQRKEFNVMKEQWVNIRGCRLKNYCMEKRLPGKSDIKIKPLNKDNVKRLSQDHGSYVGCIILTHDNQILLQIRDGRFHQFANCISTFGGRIEPGEKPDQALQRELLEELGAKVDMDDVTFLGAYTEAITDFTDVIYGYFWHEKKNSISGCFEGKPLYLQSISEVLQLKNVMDDVPYLLDTCKNLSLMK